MSLILWALLAFYFMSSCCEMQQITDGPGSQDSCQNEFQCQQCDEKQIQCINKNFSNLDAIKNASPRTQSIKFTGNSIPKIAGPIFSQQMIDLLSLDLSNNMIESLIGLGKLPNLTELTLDDNRIDLEELERSRVFEPLSSTLKSLSLSNAFKRSGEDQKTRSSFTDVKLHSLFQTVPKLNVLKLINNSLEVFNVDNTVDLPSLTQRDTNYEDILCLLPDLERLYLNQNRLTRLRFELSCVNQVARFNLSLLRLDSNRFTNFGLDVIRALKRFKAKNDRFRVFLADNPFRCDCSMYEFYKFVVSNESDRLVEDKSRLVCSHDDSISMVYGKRVLEASIDRLCGYLPEGSKFTYVFTTRAKTTLFNTTSSGKQVLHSKHKLILFMFASLVISGLIAFILKVHCFKMLRFSNLNWYKSLRHPSGNNGGENFNATTVNGGAPESLFDREHQRIILNPVDVGFEVNEAPVVMKRETIISRIGSKLSFFRRNRYKTVLVSRPLELGASQSSLTYEQLDEMGVQGRRLKPSAIVRPPRESIAQLSNKLKLKNIGIDGSDESDKEEIVVDTVARGNLDKVYVDISPAVLAGMRT